MDTDRNSFDRQLIIQFLLDITQVVIGLSRVQRDGLRLSVDFNCKLIV